MTHVIVTGRNGGKTLAMQKKILQTWPQGGIAFISKGEIRISELADAIEIKD